MLRLGMLTFIPPLLMAAQGGVEPEHPKFGVIHYNAPGKTVDEFLRWAKDAGFGYVELQISDVWRDGIDPEVEAKRVKALADSLGIKVSALSAGNDFVVLDEQKVNAQVERMRRVCELAKLLGTNVVRTEGGSPKPEVPEDRWVDAIAGCLIRCKEFIEPMGIYLAVDNHGYITNNVPLQIEIFKKVNSKHVGANVDTMNYRWRGTDLATLNRWYENIAPYALHTHMKDGTGSLGNYKGAALGEGEINLLWAVQCLKRAGYKGVWCAEYEGSEDPAVGYKKCLEWMKKHIK
ncbi:MAG: sugar phosphate isomerase/epimerase family protein [Armatimonadota bacterium]